MCRGTTTVDISVNNEEINKNLMTFIKYLYHLQIRLTKGRYKMEEKRELKWKRIII